MGPEESTTLHGSEVYPIDRNDRAQMARMSQIFKYDVPTYWEGIPGPNDESGSRYADWKENICCKPWERKEA